MKYQQAMLAAEAEAKKNPRTIFVVVNEGIHNPDREFDANCDDPSFGYCPLGGEKMLYRYGAVVATLAQGGAEVLMQENAAELLTMKADALLAKITGKPVTKQEAVPERSNPATPPWEEAEIMCGNPRIPKRDLEAACCNLKAQVADHARNAAANAVAIFYNLPDGFDAHPLTPAYEAVLDAGLLLAEAEATRPDCEFWEDRPKNWDDVCAELAAMIAHGEVVNEATILRLVGGAL